MVTCCFRAQTRFVVPLNLRAFLLGTQLSADNRNQAFQPPRSVGLHGADDGGSTQLVLRYGLGIIAPLKRNFTARRRRSFNTTAEVYVPRFSPCL